MRRLCMVLPLVLLFASWIFPLLMSKSDAETLEWVRRYNAPYGDIARAIAVDAQGNVCVTGYSGGMACNDYLTVKYSATGDRLWVKRYNGTGALNDEAYAIAVDAQGNVYVTGGSYGASSMEDCVTIKYSAAGDRLWVKRYNGPGNGSDAATALALDSEGNVHVAGYASGVDSGYDFVTIKYSPSGELLWAKRYSGPGNNSDDARAIAVDAEGNVYVAGGSVGVDGNSDYVTIKYSAAGDRLWVKRYKCPDGCAIALAVDADGNAYVTGTSPGGASSYDYVTIKYGPGGDLLWAKRYNGPGNGEDWASALAVDAQGNVYVTGYSKGTTEDPLDYATVKYGPTGDRLWVRRYSGPGNGSDWARAIALDAQGNVYVTGESLGIGKSTEWSEDYATVKYSPAGVQLWEQRYSAPGDGSDWANAVTVDAQGNVYVTGESEGVGSGKDYATIKYSQE